MGKLPLTEFIDVFPLLITKQEIFGYDDDEEAEVVNTILDDGNLGNHDLIDKGHTSTTRDFFESFPKLKNCIQSAIKEYSKKVGLEEPTITHSWYGVYDQGGKIIRHNHSGSVISGAYYPYVEKKYTSIIFENPTMVLRPTDPIISATNYSTQAKGVPVQQGDLVLFPSYMYHWTDPNNSGKRCVVSFNSQTPAFSG